MRRGYLAAIAASVAAVAASSTPFDWRGYVNSAIMPASDDTVEDRRRRNLAAGGRDKRIKRNKSLRSLPRRRNFGGSRTPGFGRLFKSDKREAAFGAAQAAGISRNEAAKIARRVTA